MGLENLNNNNENKVEKQKISINYKQLKEDLEKNLITFDSEFNPIGDYGCYRLKGVNNAFILGNLPPNYYINDRDFKKKPVIQIDLVPDELTEQYNKLYKTNPFGYTEIFLELFEKYKNKSFYDSYSSSEEYDYIPESEDGYRAGGRVLIKWTAEENFKRKEPRLYEKIQDEIERLKKEFSVYTKKITLLDLSKYNVEINEDNNESIDEETWKALLENIHSSIGEFVLPEGVKREKYKDNSEELLNEIYKNETYKKYFGAIQPEKEEFFTTLSSLPEDKRDLYLKKINNSEYGFKPVSGFLEANVILDTFSIDDRKYSILLGLNTYQRNNIPVIALYKGEFNFNEDTSGDFYSADYWEEEEVSEQNNNFENPEKLILDLIWNNPTYRKYFDSYPERNGMYIKKEFDLIDKDLKKPREYETEPITVQGFFDAYGILDTFTINDKQYSILIGIDDYQRQNEEAIGFFEGEFDLPKALKKNDTKDTVYSTNKKKKKKKKPTIENLANMWDDRF